MVSASRQPVGAVALLLVVVAAIGLYLGYSRVRATPGETATAGEESGAAPASLPAKAAIPVPDAGPPPPVPDEAFIRKIAREEVQAALRPKKPAPVSDADADDNGDDDSDVEAAPPIPPTAPKPQILPHLAQPPPPPPPPI